MQTLFFDIETGPLPDGELAALIPPFDRSEVKVGNLGPEKAAQKILEAEQRHWQEFHDHAALDPLTGQVLAIGMLYADSGEAVVIEPGDDEAGMLREFWGRCRGEQGRVHQLVGFNICQFDLPFLFRRSWKHRVPVPFGYRRGRYWSDQVVDLREIWQAGDRQARGSLDSIARHLGVGQKNGNGQHFAQLWQEDPLAALQYLHNDLRLTYKVAEAMGVIQ
jgi:hypothetical protein